MRARLIKPGFYKSEELAALPLEARVLFSGLWCLADRAGRLKDRPRTIKAEVFPFDDYDVPTLLNRLADAGFIDRYGGVIQVVNFLKHQSPHVREQPTSLPSRDEHDASTVPAPVQHQSSPAVPITVPIAVPVASDTSVSVADATAPLVAGSEKKATRGKPTRPPAKPSWIERHPFFEPLVNQFGRPGGLEWSLWGREIGTLIEKTNTVPPEATAKEIPRRVRQWSRVMGSAQDGTPIVMTLTAFIKHWHLLAPGGPNGRGPSHSSGDAQQPDPELKALVQQAFRDAPRA